MGRITQIPIVGLLVLGMISGNVARADCTPDVVGVPLNVSAFKSLDVAQTIEDADPNSCVDKLLPEDRKFLETLKVKMGMVCPPEKSDCLGEARKVFDSSVRAYWDHQGSAAVKRISIAVQAQNRKNEVEQALELMKDPKVAPTFVQFALDLQDYNQAVDDSVYKGHGAFVRNAGVIRDNLLHTRRGERPGEAYAKLIASSAQFLRQIDQMPGVLEETKNRFRAAVVALQSAVERRTQAAQKPIQESAENISAMGDTFFAIGATGTAVEIFGVGLAGLGAADTLVAAAAAVVKAAGLGAVVGGLGSAGAEKGRQTAEIFTKALLASKKSGTRLGCEMAHVHAQNAEAASKELWEAVASGTLMGAAFGGGFTGAAHVPIAGHSLVTAAGLYFSISGVDHLLTSQENLETEKSKRLKELEGLSDKMLRGEISKASYDEARDQYDEWQAKYYGDTTKHLINGGAMFAGLGFSYSKFRPDLMAKVGSINSRIGGSVDEAGEGDSHIVRWTPAGSTKADAQIQYTTQENGTRMVYRASEAARADLKAQSVNTMLLAKAVASLPEVKSLEAQLTRADTEAYQLARMHGLTKDRALKETPTYKTAAEIGFTELKSDAEDGMVALVLEKPSSHP